MQRLLHLFLLAALCVACSKKQETAVTTSSTTAQSATTSSSASTTVTTTTDTCAKEGFKPIADLTIPQELKDGVTFPMPAQVPGRWLRITVKSLNGAGGYGQIMELRAFGDRLTPGFKITIEGHTDSTSTPEHNQQLLDRAENRRVELAGT